MSGVVGEVLPVLRTKRSFVEMKKKVFEKKYRRVVDENFELTSYHKYENVFTLECQ